METAEECATVACSPGVGKALRNAMACLSHRTPYVLVPRPPLSGAAGFHSSGSSSSVLLSLLELLAVSALSWLHLFDQRRRR